VNGLAIRTQQFSDPIELDDSGLMIGRVYRKHRKGEFFYGDFCDIRVWNVARSPNQIRQSLSARLSGKEPGLVGFWNFENGTARDLTGNGNNGAFEGNAGIVNVAAEPQRQKP
jgi:hypothetical protein